MASKLKFQYSILRYRHDLITGEYLNVGLALYSSGVNYFKVKLLNRYRRITTTFPKADGDFLKSYLEHLQFEFDTLTDKFESQQPVLLPEMRGPYTLEGLLNKILPHDDSAIFFEKPISGLVEDLDRFFDDLYERLVMHYIDTHDRETRSDEEVWGVYRTSLSRSSVLSRLQEHTVRVAVDEIKFDHAWKNGKWKILQPVSFDLKNPTTIKKKAREWVGTTYILGTAKDLSELYFLLGAPSLQNPGANKAYGETKDMLNLRENGLKITLIEENEADDFAKHISPVIEKETDDSLNKK